MSAKNKRSLEEEEEMETEHVEQAGDKAEANKKVRTDKTGKVHVIVSQCFVRYPNMLGVFIGLETIMMNNLKWISRKDTFFKYICTTSLPEFLLVLF